MKISINELNNQFEDTHGCSKEYFTLKKKVRRDGKIYYTDRSLDLCWIGYVLCAVNNNTIKGI